MKFKTCITALALGVAFVVLPVANTVHAQSGNQDRREERAKYRECRDAAKAEGLRGYRRFLSIERCLRGR
jgi:hypothetical protein